MRSKNHYEMREYNMDVLQDEKDPSFCAQGRPYPIYPSKGGLSSNFLRDVISRLDLKSELLGSSMCKTVSLKSRFLPSCHEKLMCLCSFSHLFILF